MLYMNAGRMTRRPQIIYPAQQFARSKSPGACSHVELTPWSHLRNYRLPATLLSPNTSIQSSQILFRKSISDSCLLGLQVAGEVVYSDQQARPCAINPCGVPKDSASDECLRAKKMTYIYLSVNVWGRVPLSDGCTCAQLRSQTTDIQITRLSSGTVR